MENPPDLQEIAPNDPVTVSDVGQSSHGASPATGSMDNKQVNLKALTLAWTCGLDTGSQPAIPIWQLENFGAKCRLHCCIPLPSTIQIARRT